MAYDYQQLKRMVANAADLTSAARELSERDRDYYDEHQWTAEEIAVFKKRKQPIITANRIKRKIDAMVGIEQRSRVEPRAFPRNPNDEEAADIATKALVFVDDNTRFDSKKSAAFENMLVEGYGGVEVVVEEKRGQMEIAINRLRWEEIFFDGHSREKDFSDASYLGYQKWMSLDAAVDLYGETYEGGDLEELLTQMMSYTQDGETYDDRPRENSNFMWADKRLKRVRVATMYYRKKGVWYLAIFCGGGEIFNGESPYQDEDGKPCCPIELMTAYIDRENNRYGVVRGMISQQDEINHRRSKSLNDASRRNTIGVKGAVDSVAAMKRERDTTGGHIEINAEAFEDAARVGMKPFEILSNQDQAAAHFQLLQEAKNEIDLVGPNPALVGQSASSASGRAIMAQQQAGLAEMSPIYDSLRDWTIRVYRAIWARIRQYWTEERWIRVTDENEAPEWIGINRTVGQQYAQGPDNMIYLVPQVENAVAEMDMDIIIEDAPDYVSLQAEQFEQLSNMASQGIPVPPEMIIEASSLRNKAQLLERLKEDREQAMAAQMQQGQAMAMAEQQRAQIEAMKGQASAQKDMAYAQKTMAEVAETQADTEKTQVETMRLVRGF